MCSNLLKKQVVYAQTSTQPPIYFQSINLVCRRFQCAMLHNLLAIIIAYALQVQA
jgi:hypothetical protein